MAEQIYDLTVIGGGPGGYVAAIRAAQMGMSVAVVEERSTLGGVCLNEGCIPSKALLDSSELFALARDRFAGHGILIDPPRLDLAALLKRKDGVVKRLTGGIASLFKKHSITLVQGRGHLEPAGGGKEHRVTVSGGESKKQTLKSRRVLLATGGLPVELPDLPFDGKRVVGAREALAFTEVPGHLVVVGGGYIGLELGSVWLRLGSKVTVIEALPALLPHSDPQAVEVLSKALGKQGMEFHLATRVTGGEAKGGKVRLNLEGEKGKTERLDADRVLVAVGRRPASEGLAEAGLELDDRGRVKVDEDYQTSVPGVYAVGDLIPGPMLAHKAMEEGVACIERMEGRKTSVEYPLIPGVIYTHPEIASVGRTEEALREAGVAYRVGKFPFMASGRARCLDETEGFVKVLAAEEGGRLLGVHIVGPRASELIAEATAVMAFEGCTADIALTCHAHPTLAEAFKEAALAAGGEAIHM